MPIPSGYQLFLTKTQIDVRIEEMAASVAGRFDPSETILVGILGGALFFMADFVRHLAPEYHLDFLSLSSYFGGDRSTGRIVVNKDVTTDCRERTIVILDDILDSGRTLQYAKDHLKELGARQVECAVLLAKEQHRGNSLAEHVGFWVPESFYIGYGLDIGGQFRGLREIYKRG